MKKLFITATLVLGLTASFAACSDDNDKDTTKPVIENLEPQDGDKLQIGKAIHFGADISDNKGLKMYKIDIHGNFDNHGNHKGAQAEGVPFAYTKVYTTDKTGGTDLNGMKNAHLHHHEIVIPTEIDGKPVLAGNYHFVLYVIDAEGNESLQSSNVILTYDAVDTDH